MNGNASQIADQALALPTAERVKLAQKLWESLTEAERNSLIGDESATIELAKKRDAELSDGSVAHRSHEDVMESARKSMECG